MVMKWHAPQSNGILRFSHQSATLAPKHGGALPIYRQKALSYLGYKEGDFPVSDAHTEKIITFPCDQHLEKKHLDHIIETVKIFYK